MLPVGLDLDKQIQSLLCYHTHRGIYYSMIQSFIAKSAVIKPRGRTICNKKSN